MRSTITGYRKLPVKFELNTIVLVLYSLGKQKYQVDKEALSKDFAVPH